MVIKAETELYEPIKSYFENIGFNVKAEVKSCDLTAIKDNTLLIVELKTSFNLKLVYQALERKTVTPLVYVAIPRPKNFRTKSAKMMIKLLKEIKIGLITVGIESDFKSVDIVLEPENGKITNNKKRKQILTEFERRKTDFNIGGEKSKGRIITAYREKSVEIACLAEKLGKITPKIARELSSAEKPESILQTNCYKWFERIKKGTYVLSTEGKNALEDLYFSDLVAFYRKEVNNKNV